MAPRFAREGKAKGNPATPSPGPAPLSVTAPPKPVEGTSDHFLSAAAARHCADEIRDAGGVEVFFIGRRDDSGLIAEIESHAFGTEDCVPALMNLAQPGDVILHNHPSGNLMPSDADISVASAMGNMGVGCYIINNDCSRCRVVVKPQDPRKKVVIEEREILAALSPGGRVSQVLSDFEDRPQQREMATAVAHALNHDGISIVEAGTGTGKSFAYLYPAILYALRNGERIVISTNTINLQEQLLNKDVPALRTAVGEEFQVEIVKGRSNYVCKRKAEFARDEAQLLLEDDFQRELKEVLAWAASSPTGDLQELPITPRNEVWERVQSEADNCLRVRCRFYEECFFYNSRRRAARARLLIVNHSLLMSDLAVRRATNNYTTAAVLPPYTRVVLDEAHHLEEVATNNLAQQITRPGLRQMFSRLYRKDGGGSHGALASLSDEIEKLAERKLIDHSTPIVQRLLFDLMPRVGDIRESLDFLFDDFCRQFQRVARIGNLSPREEQKIRIVPEIRADPLWEECLSTLQAMGGELAGFIDLNRKLLESFGEQEEPVTLALTNPLLEWQALVGRIDGLRRTVMAFMDDDQEQCRWVEMRARPAPSREILVRLCIAPVDVRGVLRTSLHDRMKSEVLTSATLAVDRKFDFFSERAGLPEVDLRAKTQQYDEDGMPIIEREVVEARPVLTKLLSTPFDYREQVFFAVPTDLPDPRESDFDTKFADLVNRSIAITGGRAFILFTSYGQLKRIADICEPTIRRLGIEVLRQGTESRETLLAKFREDETSVLFATSSFWEGVDVKGRSLELLIIAKLPFAVPTEPIQEAQFEALKRRGKEPFDHLVVPRAVIRFKQGFGRLIRARTDRGAVIVADKRVVQMRYGKRFLHSLPDIRVRQGQMLNVMGEMKEFFAGPAPTG